MKLLVIAVGKYMMSRGLRMLCNAPETPTQWKSESVTDQTIDRDGASRDADASGKDFKFSMNWLAGCFGHPCHHRQRVSCDCCDGLMS